MCDAGCAQKEFARFTGFISGANGRDKFSKSLQYSSRLLFYILTTSASASDDTIDLGKRLKKFSGGVSTSRKCNRILKSLAEYNKIITILSKQNDDPVLAGLKIAYAFAYSLYWYYDNKVFFGKVGLSKTINVKESSIKGSRWWLLGLFFNFFIIVKEIQKLQAKKRKSLNGEENEQLSEQLFLKQLNLVSWCGDVTCASNAAGYVEMARGHGFNDGILGAAGLMSACITLYRIYPAMKK